MKIEPPKENNYMSIIVSFILVHLLSCAYSIQIYVYIGRRHSFKTIVSFHFCQFERTNIKDGSFDSHL